MSELERLGDGRNWEEWGKKKNEELGICIDDEEVYCVDNLIEVITVKTGDDGFGEEIERKNFDNFEVYNEELDIALKISKDFVENDEAICLLLMGNTGSGKTHLATAVCGALRKTKKVRVKKVRYTEMVADLKYISFDLEERIKVMDKYKKVSVLFIDDLFKGSVTDVDLRNVFEVIDYRYLNGKTTIVTTEYGRGEMDDLKEGSLEAIKGRLIEMSKGYYLEFKSTKSFREILSETDHERLIRKLRDK